MKKKVLLIIAALICVLFCCFVFAACDNASSPQNGQEAVAPDTPDTPDFPLIPSEGLEYKLNDDGTGYEVIGVGTCIDKNIVIPSTYNDLPVVAITDKQDPQGFTYWAFGKCDWIESVVIPDSISVIGAFAFYDCTNLKNIFMPDSLLMIGHSVFNNSAYYNDNNNWENGSLYIGKHLIKVKSAVGDVSVKQGTVTIANMAFEKCSYVTNINLPSSVMSIGYGAFYDCRKLKDINIPESVTNIGDCAFNGCINLESITVASGNTKYHSAGGCLIETASKKLIAGCNNSVIPADGSVTIIGDCAFNERIELTSITIPNSVTSIGDHAFYDCRLLTSITIPDSVTSIGYGAFDGCSKLSYHVYENGVYLGNGNNRYLVLIEVRHNDITSCIINSTTKIIYSGAFRKCSELTSITIGNNVTSIGAWAFYDCASLDKVYYAGSASDWSSIDISTDGNQKLTDATIYYYSETQPTSGNYWHYDNDGVTSVEW